MRSLVCAAAVRALGLMGSSSARVRAGYLKGGVKKGSLSGYSSAVLALKFGCPYATSAVVTLAARPLVMATQLGCPYAKFGCPKLSTLGAKLTPADV